MSLGLVVPIFGGRPVFIIIFSQTLAAVAPPLIVIPMLALLNRKEVKGDHTATMGFNIVMIIIALFTVATTNMGIVGGDLKWIAGWMD